MIIYTGQMADLDETTMARLARELVMAIRPYQVVFAEFGINETDYQQIEKNEFFRKVKAQLAQEWNSALSTEERLRCGSLAYLEQLTPIITKRAMATDANLAAATDVSKVLMKMAGVGEARAEKSTAERFVITINLGADVEHFDKSIEINPNDISPAAPKAIT